MNSTAIGKPIIILLVEDNPGDVRLVQETFKEWKVCNNLQIVRDGVEAMAYLRREGEYVDKPHPDLILLDLNLPRKNGIEVLDELKHDEVLKRIPVVILTASQAEEDILRAYNLHANCYIVKSIDFDEFIRVVQAIKEFWLDIVKLPGD